jgi:hypothetical protein
MPVTYTFANATAAIPLSQLDNNFATPITIGNVAIQLGNTVSSIGNVTLANATVSNSTLGNVTITSVASTFPNNYLSNSSVTIGNTAVALGSSASTIGNVTLTNATLSSLATPITTAEGGTGLSGSTPFTANGVVYASSTSALATGSALTFDGTNFKVGVGGVGQIQIGTASSSSFQTALYSSNGVDTDFQVRFKTGVSDIGLSTATALSFSISNAEKMRLTSAGNLGIGTSSPSTALTVNGALSSIGPSSIYGIYRRDTNAYVGGWYSASGTITLDSAVGAALNIDTSGNLGLGVTPSAWSGTALQVTNAAVYSYNGQDFRSQQNIYFDGTNYRYITANPGSFMLQYQNTYSWYISSGTPTVGGVASLTQAMTLDASGNWMLGTTTSSGRMTAGLGGGHTFNVGLNGTTLGNTNGVLLSNYLNQTTLVAAINLSATASDAGAIIFGTASAGTLAEAARIDSSGNLGLGVTPSAWWSAYKVLEMGALGNSIGAVNAGSQIQVSANAFQYGPGTYKYGQTGYAATLYSQSNGSHSWLTAPSGTAGNAISFTQAMTLDNSGNLLVGTTSIIGSSLVNFKTTSTSQNGLSVTCTATTGFTPGIFSRTGSDGTAIAFNRGGSDVGTITITTTATAYNTSSDQRLKTNIVDAPQGNIDQIKIRSFDWLSDGSHQEYGVIAQELLEVAPYAVSVPENPDEMMGVDYSKLVPMMIKEIQSLKAEVATLKGA